METSRKFVRDNRHLMYVLAAVSILLTLYTMPREKARKYVWTIDKPWTYNTLIAPFSFSVEKDPALLQSEKNALETSFAPYFSCLDRNGVMEEFDRYYADTMKTAISPDACRAVRERLQNVYRRGLASARDQEMLEGKSLIRKTSGKVATLTPVDSVFSIRDAYAYLLEADIPAADRSALLGFRLEDYLVPNLEYDVERSTSDLNAELAKVSQYAGMVMAGQKIIDQGEMVDAGRDMEIRSYLKIVNERAWSKTFMLFSLGGQSLLVVICFLFLILYLNIYRLDDIENRKILYFLFTFVTFSNVVLGLYCQYAPWSVMLVPCTILAIVLRIFLDSRTAFMGYLVFVLTTSIYVSMPYEYVMLQLVAGLTGIYSLKELSQRSQILRTCLLIFLSYSLVWTAIRLVDIEDLKSIDPIIYLYFAINSILVLLVYPLLFMIEKGFGFVSNVTLIELSNINNPLLRELAEKAPGTFQHSMQVSTLAAEAATAVKANSQLVRTAALYHDIGKIESAPFFTENQNGAQNPHDRLTPQQSARIITDHVEAGLKLADRFSLPPEIRKFISTHHGKGVARFFYLKYKQEHPDTEPEMSAFSYPGPDPDTKETAILMMADAAEASSRSLKEYTEESIGELVDKIIDRQVSEGHFNGCPLNWHEVAKIKDVFKEKLRTMYHTRVSYPDDTTAGQRQNAK